MQKYLDFITSTTQPYFVCFLPTLGNMFGRRIVTASLLSKASSRRTIPALLSSFSTNQSGKKKQKSEQPELSYYQQKAAAKQHRRELYEKKQERIERLKTRRAGRPRLFYRNEFRSFFIPKKVHDEHHNRKARQQNLEWEICASAIVERISVVQPDREPWEIEMDDLQTHLAQFGKQYPKELVSYDNYKSYSHEELLEMLPFEPAPRETPADADGNIKTMERKLKTSIYLLLKQEEELWDFPSVILEPEETLLDGAKRAMNPLRGLKFWSPSNSPWSVRLTPFDDKTRKKTKKYGRKTFFVKMQYDSGAVTSESMDYAWLDRSEVTDLVEKAQGRDMSKLYHYML